MALTFLQKLRLGLRRAMSTSASSDQRKREDLVARNTPWLAKDVSGAAQARDTNASGIDLEGLQVAYLDDSGQFDHFYDRESGDVIDRVLGSPEAIDSGWIPIPRRSAESDAADRTAFAHSIEKTASRERLLAAASDAKAFRAALGEDRTLERRWYNFKNDRASEAIAQWLHEQGLA